MRLRAEPARRYFYQYHNADCLEELSNRCDLVNVIADRYSVFFSIVSSIWRRYPSFALRLRNYYFSTEDKYATD